MAISPKISLDPDDLAIIPRAVITQYRRAAAETPRMATTATVNLLVMVAATACQHQFDVLVNPRFAPDSLRWRANFY
jgi:hypothetical protein